MPHRAVRVPILVWDGRHQLPPLDRPVDEQLSLFPAGVHCFALQDHHHDEVAVLFKAARQTRPRCLSDPRLAPCEAVDAQQAVCVQPVVALLVLDVHRLCLFFNTGGLFGRLFVRAAGAGARSSG